MIGWLQSLDVSLFRFINSSLSNPVFDRLMPFLSNSPWFACILIAICLWLLFCGGARGRICVLMLVLSLCIGNWLIVDTIKHVVGRLRPFHTLPDVHLRIGMGDSFSMPSSHAANWFSAAVILFVYFRRSIWVMLPLAFMVSLSRIYNGVHYPSDTLVGASVGIGYSLAVIYAFDWLWQKIGTQRFPVWHARLPSLSNPIFTKVESSDETEWLRLGYILIFFTLFLGLAYIGSGKIELSEDEAYQWLWSKHLALSYYSKPPLIAYTQFLGTHLWGDNEFGVRFFSPVIAAILSLMVLRFLTREVSARLAVIVIAAMTVTPLLALGSTVMTVDPSVRSVLDRRDVRRMARRETRWNNRPMAPGRPFYGPWIPKQIHKSRPARFLVPFFPALAARSQASPQTRSLACIVNHRAVNTTGDHLERPARLDHRPPRRQRRPIGRSLASHLHG